MLSCGLGVGRVQSGCQQLWHRRQPNFIKHGLCMHVRGELQPGSTFSWSAPLVTMAYDFAIGSLQFTCTSISTCILSARILDCCTTVASSLRASDPTHHTMHVYAHRCRHTCTCTIGPISPGHHVVCFPCSQPSSCLTSAKICFMTTIASTRINTSMCFHVQSLCTVYRTAGVYMVELCQ